MACCTLPACFEEKSRTARVKLCSLSLSCSCLYFSDLSNCNMIRHLHGLTLFAASCCSYSGQHWWGESGHGLVARIFAPVLVYPGEGIATLGEGAEFPLLGSSSELPHATWGCFNTSREPADHGALPVLSSSRALGREHSAKGQWYLNSTFCKANGCLQPLE